ncbi:MAG TPA: radical SAM family heme chaperone HemW, partial [Acidimicrobiales bacterium]|nr:radical SAM family heme chaperone HemW [Acidimicrobiales bacterium]
MHVPFCTRRCDYCAFAAWDDRFDLVAGYVDALAAEVRRAVAAGLPAATSVFVGGGTPSLLTAAQLGAVLAEVPLRPGAEVTVECNPETVTEERLAGYAAAGVTRISLGVQSLVPRVLAALGREHDPAEAVSAVAAVRAVGFASWNVDLIYGAAGETADDWRRSLDGVLALEPPHVSAYALTVEPGTPLADDPARAPDDDVQAEAYLAAEAAFSGAGLANYEISNWARPSHECRHNLLYWAAGEYRGFGCAAHSHAGGRRWWNVRTPERYVAAVRAGGSTEAAGEALAPAER